MKYNLLDLFCCAGGASYGYFMAGFDCTGIDIDYQPRYPFKFIQSDVMSLTVDYLRKFDFIHASPPCQEYSITKYCHTNVYPELIEPVRNLLKNSGVPYVIENVPGAPMENPLHLVGSMFGLKVVRRRLFESNLPLYPPSKYYLDGFQDETFCVVGKSSGIINDWRKAMGIHWMVKKELVEAIPPLYTEWIGTQVINYLWAEKKQIEIGMSYYRGVNVDKPGQSCRLPGAKVSKVEPAAC